MPSNTPSSFSESRGHDPSGSNAGSAKTRSDALVEQLSTPSSRWEIFPRLAWPRGFGFREWTRSRELVDGDQLELSWELVATCTLSRTPLENLRAVLDRSKLPQREFAQWVLGCAEYTLTRYLGGKTIPECRRNFLARLESVATHGEYLVITLKTGELRRLRWWDLARRPQY